MKYLGHVISKEGVTIAPEKISAVATFSEPKTQKDVRSFLEMCNYYEKFVQSNSSSPILAYIDINKPFEIICAKNTQTGR